MCCKSHLNMCQRFRVRMGKLSMWLTINYYWCQKLMITCNRICLSVCLSVCLSIYLPVCLSVYLYVCLSVCLTICLSVCPSIYLFHEIMTLFLSHLSTRMCFDVHYTDTSSVTLVIFEGQFDQHILTFKLIYRP